MGRALSLCGVILAAGESSRMGSDKALLPWPPASGAAPSKDTFLSSAIKLFTPHVDLVLVVVGRNAAQLAPIIYANGASLVVNPDPGRGQFSSLQTGVQEVLGRGRDAAMITLVDRPPVRPETVQSLLEAFALAVDRYKWALVPEYQGRHGHPFLAAREMIEAFLKAPHTSNARDVEHANQGQIEYLSLDDPWIVANVDTREQYEALFLSGAPVR